MKKVTVYSTVGKKATILENVEATDWSGLKTLMRNQGVEYNRMKAVVGETRNTLESDKATLPEGDFSLFLMPVKTKSGGSERKELMEQYKASPSAKEYFKGKGLQITRMPTADIKRELANVGVVSSASEDIKPIPAPAAKSTPTSNDEEKYKKIIIGKLQELKSSIEEASDDGDNEPEVADEFADKVDSIIALVNAGIDGISKLEKEASEAEKKRIAELDSKAHEIAGDFDDIRSF